MQVAWASLPRRTEVPLSDPPTSVGGTAARPVPTARLPSLPKSMLHSQACLFACITELTPREQVTAWRLDSHMVAEIDWLTEMPDLRPRAPVRVCV